MPFNPLEQYHKAQEQKKAKDAEKVIEAGPPPLAEIINNKEDSEVLRLILDREKDNIGEDKIKMFEEYLAGRTDIDEQAIQDVFQTLSPYLEELKRAKEYSKTLLEYLTLDRIKILAANNSEFRLIVNQLGPDKTQEFLKNYLYRLWVLDSDRAKNLDTQLQAIKKAELDGQKLGNDMMAIAEKYGISSEELEKIFRSDNPEEALEKLIKSHMGTLDRLKNWLGKGQLLKERLSQFKLDELKQYSNEIDRALNDASSIIKDIVFGTKKGQQFFQKAFRVAAGLEKGPMVKSTSLVEGINDIKNKDDLREAIIEVAKSEGKDINNLNELQKWWDKNRSDSKVLNSVLKELQNKKQKKGLLSSGFYLGDFFKALFSEMVDSFNFK